MVRLVKRLALLLSLSKDRPLSKTDSFLKVASLAKMGMGMGECQYLQIEGNGFTIHYLNNYSTNGSTPLGAP